MDNFNDAKIVLDIKYSFCGHHIYDGRSIFIC